MLFGGPITWKSTKQRRVVTSSTESGLVALTAAIKLYLSLSRLIEQLNLTLGEDSKLQRHS